MSVPLSAVEPQASENAAFSALASAIDQAIQSAESKPALAQRTLLMLHDEAVALAASSNDQLAETIARYPTRFSGLAAFAPNAPEAEAREI
jgi:predicted TIM-barrel fold metal-dependent hydrolase